MSIPQSRILAIAALLVGLSACQTVGIRESPWQWGYGIKYAPEFQMGDEEDAPTVHPTFSYSRLSFTGGHSNWFDLGAQMRWQLPLTVGDRSLWGGGEATVGRISGSNGLAVAGIAGIPLADNSWNPSLFIAAGITNYGATGTMIRAGVDIQPNFLPWSFR